MHPLAWFLHAEMPDDPVALCEARQWLTKAADSGDVAAMCDLVRSHAPKCRRVCVYVCRAAYVSALVCVCLS